jgi:hypothetical protein
METIHQLNIAIHVLAGTLALVAGYAAVLTNKGGKRHIRFGGYFTKVVALVIITGLIGVFVFKRNNFLLVITLLSGYECYSGIRAIKLRGSKPEWFDYFIPIVVTASAIYYLYYISLIGMYWNSTITYSTIGALFVLTFYDLCKIFMPVSFLKKAFVYEHVYKMIGALAALTSAFSGTVFPQYKPYSQTLPSVFAFTYIFATFIRLGLKQRSLNRQLIQQQN